MKASFAAAAAALVLTGLAPTAGGASADSESSGASDVRISLQALGTVPDLPMASTTVEGKGPLPEISAAALDALEETASTGGESVDEARALNAFEVVRDQIREKYPSIYTGSAIAQEPAYDFDLIFTQEPPSEVFELLRNLPSRVRVSFGAPLNSAERVTFQSQLLAAMPELGLDPRRTVIVSSALSTAIGVVTADPGGTITEKNAEEMLRKAAATEQGALGVYVNFTQQQAENVPYFVAHGGMPITKCNTAFGAKRDSNGHRGIITAAHCPDTPIYNSTGTSLGSAVLVRSGIDSQFNAVPSPHTVDNRFQWDVGSFRDVTLANDPPYGTSICTYGVAWQKNCGVVTNTSTCYGSYCEVATTSAHAGPGDSGGPCYSGNTARGIVSGGNAPDPDHQGTVTWCTLIDSIGPATILTQ